MLNDILEILISCAENSFLQVGVFVGAVLLLFGYINYKRKGGLVNKLEKSKGIQPILGSLLGLTPGCGGAIFVMPLYLKGTVTFGTVIATLIATMGDAAFVLITILPMEYLAVSLISIIVAFITGYIVDYLKIDNSFDKRRDILNKELEVSADQHKKIETELVDLGRHSKCMSHLSHKEGDPVDILFHHKERDQRSSLVYYITHKIAYKIFWSIVLIGFILGVLLLFQIDVNKSLGLPNLGLIFGVGGTGFSILYMLLNKKFAQSDTYEEEESKIFSLKETLIHNAEDTAFVSTWVFVAYFVYELAVYFLGGEAIVESWMSSAGLASVIIGALVGIIPGCGPQIIFVSLYAQGAIPFAALLANVISQDGDALFPLLAIDKKSSMKAVVITTIPALIVGILFYYIF
jgi:hypothetical protein